MQRALGHSLVSWSLVRKLLQGDVAWSMQGIANQKLTTWLGPSQTANGRLFKSEQGPTAPQGVASTLLGVES